MICMAKENDEFITLVTKEKARIKELMDILEKLDKGSVEYGKEINFRFSAR